LIVDEDGGLPSEFELDAQLEKGHEVLGNP
jgi:hypothetical protein